MNIQTAQLDGECAKQTVVAILVNNGDTWIGFNRCDSPQNICPRASYKSGEGYQLCTLICKQKNHAEIDALEQAGEDARGGTLFLIGHSAVCNSCKKALEAAGVEEVIIVHNLICKGN